MVMRQVHMQASAEVSDIEQSSAFVGSAFDRYRKMGTSKVAVCLLTAFVCRHHHELLFSRFES
eukprot:m.313196 g.313196  ORF g.313196 m.313196 type:complete len:63 (+) comp358968_c0_seq1:178-366(+)